MAAILMGSLNATAKDYHYTTVAGDAMKTRIYTLDNGLKVYMSVNKEKPRLQANIAVKTGSRNDPAETTGLAHYLEHLMFKGTQKFGTTDHAMEMFFSSYTASSSVWKPRITMFWNRSLCTFAQFSISLFGMFST